MKLIGLTGKAGVGKDTVADYLVANYGFTKYSLADPIKDMLAVIGVDARTRETKEKPHPVFGASPRRMAQTLGTEWGRMCIRNDFWLKAAELHIETVKMGNALDSVPTFNGIVIPDVRFENEAAWLRAQGGRLWHIIRDVPAVEAHSSEAGVPPDTLDVMVANDMDKGTLFRCIDWLMEK